MVAISIRHFQMDFQAWKCMNFDLSFIEFLRVHLAKYFSSGLDNGSAPTRRQAIIWNNDG